MRTAHTSLCFAVSIDPRSVSCHAVACYHRGAAVVLTPSPVPKTCCLLPTQRGMTPTPPHRRYTPVAGTAHLTVLHHFNRSPLCVLLSSRLPSPRGCCGRHATPSAQNMLPASHTTRKDPPHPTAATPPLPALHTSLCFTILIDPRSISC